MSYISIYFYCSTLSFMDFSFLVPFFCTAAAAVVAEVLTVCFKILSFVSSKKMIMNQVLISSKYYYCLNQLDVNMQSF
jgi:hypothetical protein